MRSALALGLALLALGCTGGSAPVRRVPAPIVDKGMFLGAWSHRAIIVDADPATGVVLGDERATIVGDWDLGRDALVARGEDDRALFATPILAHFHVVTEADPVTGEPLVAQTAARNPHAARFMRLDPSSTEIVDPELVPIPADAIALGAPFRDGEAPSIPRRLDDGRVVWTFLTHHDVEGGLVIVRHELEQLDPI